MKVLTGLAQVEPGAPHPVLTIGNFDGVHLGHQALIRTVVERAGKNGGTAVVMTFDPHPLKVLAPHIAPKQIQTMDQRLHCLRALGVDVIWVVPFTKEVSQITAHGFVADILGRKLGVREICVGRHFVFGKDRQGNIEFLRSLGGDLGYSVLEVEELRYRRFRISSTRIREFLLAGRVSLAARILGQPETLRGLVVKGARKGVLLGIPTANLDAENELIPKNGVYLTTAVWNGGRYPGLTNIGYRPTMASSPDHQGRPVVETHLLDFSENIYGQSMELQFHCRLRDEMQFPSVGHLVRQISVDRKKAVRYFSRVGRLEYQRVKA